MKRSRLLMACFVLALVAGLFAGCAPSSEADDDTGDDDTSDAMEEASDGMVLVPGGEFGMGCPSPDDERCGVNYRVVDVPPFFIDVFEVTAIDYVACSEAGDCNIPPEDYAPPIGEKAPAQGINWYNASDYCAWAGKRLSTSAEWEKAARGDAGGHDYPWGEQWQPTWANWCDGDSCDGSIDGYAGAAPVDAFPENVSPYGVRNMAGNMLEWTSSPSEFEDEFISIRGGSFEPDNGMGAPDLGLLMWMPIGDPPDVDPPHIGFRCAMDAE